MADIFVKSPEVDTMIERVRTFGDLTQGWDGGNGDAPTTAAVEDTVAFIQLLADEGFRLPRAMPVSDGSVALEFANHGLDLTAALDGMGHIAFSGVTKTGDRLNGQKMHFDRKTTGKDCATRAYLVDYLNRIL